MLIAKVGCSPHEINNPLSFIACNIAPTKDYITQLLHLIQIYQQTYGESDATIQAYLKEIDLEFIASDLINVLRSMGDGAERIRTVVLALRIFARLDESGIKLINIHESIESALTLLQHRLHSRHDRIKIEVRKEYGDIPLITGYADQINQVIFNLLCNAIDAIDEKIERSQSNIQQLEISLRTQRVDENHVLLSIEDTGIGIAEEYKSRIFEPFFTTRSAGLGVGLGLATCQRIVEEIHKGKLSYRSSYGEGTEFIVQLPIG